MILFRYLSSIPFMFVLRDFMSAHNVGSNSCLFSSGDKRHKCTECDRAFVKSADLKRHMAGHRNEKKFICDDCGSAFTRRDNLKAHRLLHTRESVVTCDLCSKEFINAVYLKRHMHIHKQAKKKPYEWVLHKHSNKFIYMRVMKKIVALCLLY